MTQKCWPGHIGQWMTIGALAIQLFGCGGGEGGTHARGAATAQQRASTAKALSGTATTANGAPVQANEAPTVVHLEQVSSSRVDRTRFDYVFKLHVNGSSVHVRDGVFTVTTSAGGTQVIDGMARAGSVNADRHYMLDDTITLRQDRTKPFDPARLAFSFSGQLADTLTPDGDVQIGPVAFYVTGGRPGHEGGFKSDASDPLAGDDVQLNAIVLGSPANVSYQLLNEAGAVLGTAPLTKLWADRNDHTAILVVPSQPFSIKLAATTASGAVVAWTSDLYSPRRLSARFAPSKGATFRYGDRIDAHVVVSPVQDAGGVQVSLLLPSGFAADRTSWQVTRGASATRLPVQVQAPASGPGGSFYEFVVLSSTGPAAPRWTSRTELLAR